MQKPLFSIHNNRISLEVHAAEERAFCYYKFPVVTFNMQQQPQKLVKFPWKKFVMKNIFLLLLLLLLSNAENRHSQKQQREAFVWMNVTQVKTIMESARNLLSTQDCAHFRIQQELANSIAI